MNVKWQFDDVQPIPNENCGSILTNVAEGAKEIVPVEDRTRISHSATQNILSHVRHLVREVHNARRMFMQLTCQISTAGHASSSVSYREVV